MNRRRSRPLRLEIMEERILLSSGIADPPANAPIEATRAARPFAFNGRLHVGFIGHYNRTTGETYISGLAGDLIEKSFPPMGKKVSISAALAHTGFEDADGFPNLSDWELELANAKGSLIVAFSSSTTNTYGYTISAGTGHFVSADGTTGTVVLTSPPRTEFTLTFTTSRHPA
jgi:hypothetical protein